MTDLLAAHAMDARITFAVQMIHFGDMQRSNPEEALRICSSLGITRIEANLPQLEDVEGFRLLCSKYKIEVIALHVPVAQIIGNQEAILKVACCLGCSNLICSGMIGGSSEYAIPRTAREFTAVLELCGRNRIKFLYHPFEEDLDEAESPTQLDRLLSEIRDVRFRLVIDTYWCQPILKLEASRRHKYINMCNYFHLKDGFKGRDIVRRKDNARSQGEAISKTPMFVPIGYGDMAILNWLPIIQSAAHKFGDVSLVLDQPAPLTDPAEELRLSIQSLAKWGIR